MSAAALHADAFYREAVSCERVWTIRNGEGFPAPQGDGGRAMPFWSSCRRVELIIANAAAYAGFSPFELPLDEFLERWLPGLTRDKLLVGLNWSGSRAIGFDVDPKTVAEAIQHHRASTSNKGLERP